MKTEQEIRVMLSEVIKKQEENKKKMGESILEHHRGLGRGYNKN